MFDEEYSNISELINSNDLLYSYIKEQNSFINKLVNIENLQESAEIDAYIEELKEDFSKFINKISGSNFSHIKYYFKLLSYFAVIRCKYYYVIPHLLMVLYQHFPLLTNAKIIRRYYYQNIIADLIPQQINEGNFQLKDPHIVDPKVYFEFEKNGEFLLYIYNDDIDSFIDYTVSHPNFDIYSNITCMSHLSTFFMMPTTNKHNPNNILMIDSLTLLEISCFFGSIKCFNYFILNDCPFKNQAYQFAIAGGSLDIIRKLDQTGDYYKNNIDCLLTSVSYHRNELTDWILLHSDKLNFNNLEIEEMFSCYNYEATLYFIYSIIRNNGQKPNSLDLMLLIQFSIEINNLEMFKYLFAFVDQEDSFSIFQAACEKDSIFIVKYFIEEKIVILYDYYRFIISDAYKQHFLSVTIYLIDVYTNHGKDKDNCSHLYDLFIDMVEGNDIDTLRILINDINITPKCFLHYAKDIKMAKFLIEEIGVDPEERNESMKTPLHIACDKKYSEIILYLIEEVGVDPYVADSKGKTPFLYAIKSKNGIFQKYDSLVAIETIEYFINFVGVDLYEKDSYGRYLLSYVFQHGNAGVVNYFINNVGLDPEQIDDNDKFPFQYSSLTNLRFFNIKNEFLKKTCYSNVMIDSEGRIIKKFPKYDTYNNDNDLMFDCNMISWEYEDSDIEDRFCKISEEFDVIQITKKTSKRKRKADTKKIRNKHKKQNIKFKNPVYFDLF